MGKINIPKSELIRFYYKQKKSTYEIGKIYQCSFGTVSNRMKDYGLKPMSRSLMQSKYKKRDFSGNLNDESYMIGFRLGDLSAYKTVSHSDVVIARCHTTTKDQINLMKSLFERYGKVTISNGNKRGSTYINCFLNKTFSFLLPKQDGVEKWITENSNYSNNFAAGYIDAEGNIGVYDKRARFKIDSYDKNIIFWLYEWLLKNNIFCPLPIKIALKGQIYDKKTGYKYNKDLWRIRVSIRESLKRLFIIIYPLLRHKKRRSDLRKCLRNLNVREKSKQY